MQDEIVSVKFKKNREKLRKYLKIPDRYIIQVCMV